MSIKKEENSYSSNKIKGIWAILKTSKECNSDTATHNLNDRLYACQLTINEHRISYEYRARFYV